MVKINVKCPNCKKIEISRYGKQENGAQKYKCNNQECSRVTFILEYKKRGFLKEVRDKVVDMALNGSGIRDTGRVLGISKDTVMNILKKKESIVVQVNPRLSQYDTSNMEVFIQKVDEAEMDEMWSFVSKKSNQRWLWHAIDHNTGLILAYVFGRRQNKIFKELQKLLNPFNISKYYTDPWQAYGRNLESEKHFPGKRNTQKIERKHLTLRTRIKRLVRKTICFSKSQKMHDLVIGLFINRYEFKTV